MNYMNSYDELNLRRDLLTKLLAKFLYILMVQDENFLTDKLIRERAKWLGILLNSIVNTENQIDKMIDTIDLKDISSVLQE